MCAIRKWDQRVRQQLRRYGVKFNGGGPSVVWVNSRWNPLDYICSYYDEQDGDPLISIKAMGTDWLVRHEYGHFLVDTYGLRDRSIYDKRFGDAGVGDNVLYEALVPVARTVDTVWRKWFGFHAPLGYPSFYALLNGEEDFCECLALLLSTRGSVERAADGDEVLEDKLVAVKRILRNHCRRPRY